jgi:hypothetical protein
MQPSVSVEIASIWYRVSRSRSSTSRLAIKMSNLVDDSPRDKSGHSHRTCKHMSSIFPVMELSTPQCEISSCGLSVLVGPSNFTRCMILVTNNVLRPASHALHTGSRPAPVGQKRKQSLFDRLSAVITHAACWCTLATNDGAPKLVPRFCCLCIKPDHNLEHDDLLQRV